MNNQENQFEVLRAEFITSTFPSELKYIHWSRIYEWRYVLDSIKNHAPRSIHNTACGGLNSGDCLHLTFCDDIDRLCKNAIHSDVWGGDYPGVKIKPSKPNFVRYDITTPFERKFDMVLSISTLEHLEPPKRLAALQYLGDQVEPGGHLILTFDFPDIDAQEIERVYGAKIKISPNIVSNGRIAVILMHLKKQKTPKGLHLGA